MEWKYCKTAAFGRDLRFCCPHGLEVCGWRQCQAGRPPTLLGNRPGKVNTTSITWQRRRFWDGVNLLFTLTYREVGFVLIPIWYFYKILYHNLFVRTALRMLKFWLGHTQSRAHTHTEKGVVPPAFFGRVGGNLCVWAANENSNESEIIDERVELRQF